MGVHFVHWVAIYLADEVICPLNNLGQQETEQENPAQSFGQSVKRKIKTVIYNK